MVDQLLISAYFGKGGYLRIKMVMLFE